MVANHPLGMQDALALLQLIGSVRLDVSILGNDWLATVPQLGRLRLPVDVFGKGAASQLRGIYRALDDGQALIIFPAGEVSRMRPPTACVTGAGRTVLRGWHCGEMYRCCRCTWPRAIRRCSTACRCWPGR